MSATLRGQTPPTQPPSGPPASPPTEPSCGPGQVPEAPDDVRKVKAANAVRETR
jgi:hypothetical protein